MTANKILAIIPARGGSKGLPRKNILELAGKPLIAWTIEACIKCDFIGKILVSSDDEEILSVAKQYGSETILRPKQLASDSALTVPVITHALSTLGKNLEEYSYIALLQPTSPLRNSSHITEAFRCLKSNEATSVISVTQSAHNPLKSFFLNDGYLEGIVNNEYPFMRRQDLPDTYQANGAIYIVDLNEFKENNSLLTAKTIPFKMDEKSSLDIDTLTDLVRAEKVIGLND
ncbi:MAG: acylneuraminate cytidylyltransferase family protein [Colwellia sp.]|jgi:CMP-N-acetylneuraminic acid synthetase